MKKYEYVAVVHSVGQWHDPVRKLLRRCNLSFFMKEKTTLQSYKK